MNAEIFEKLLKQERQALATAWEAFLSIHKEGKVPYPSLYSQEFTRRQGKIGDREPELVQILEEASRFLNRLLTMSKKEAAGTFTLTLKREEVLTIYELHKKLRSLEQEISFLREELLKDPLTNFWNLRGLQRIFDHVIKKYIYSEDYLLLTFYVLLPGDKQFQPFINSILRACAHFLRGLFSPKDFFTRPQEKTFAIICVGRAIQEIQELIERLKGKSFPCRIGPHRLSIRYLVGGTNILGADSLPLVLERALSAAQRGTFIRV